MRRTVIGLAMAGVLVLGACGGDDDGGGDSAEEEAGGENGGQEGGRPRDTSPEAVAFCEGFANLAQQGASGNPADPSAIVGQLSALEPPAEIAEDFAVAVEAAEAQAQAMSGGSADPEAAQQFQENAERYTEANANVTAYVTENCEFNMPGAEGGTGGGEAPTESSEATTETTAAAEGGG